jgi:uncharacterized protein YdeI (YjbR/CyaY-like superfamily)
MPIAPLPGLVRATTVPVYFESSAAWRAWLEEHHATETEMWVGLWKVRTGRAVLTWEVAVREAPCFGWIDGVGRRVADERKAQRFTPRKSTTWSAKNVRLVGELEAAGLMRDAGRAAFAARDAASDYAVGAWPDRLPDDLEAQLREDAAAAAFWDAAPPSYRKVAAFHVTSARRPETVAKRLAQLIEDSAAGLRLKQHRR